MHGACRPTLSAYVEFVMFLVSMKNISKLLIAGLLSFMSRSFAQSPPLGQSPCRAGDNLKQIVIVAKKASDGSDTRAPITEAGPKLGLSSREITDIRNSSCLIRCQGKSFHILGSGTLLGDGSTLLTAGHLFFDLKTKKPKDSNSNCSFTTQGIPPIQRRLIIKLDNPSSMRLGKNYPKDEWGDYAVIKVDPPVPGIHTLPINLADKAIDNGTITYVATASQSDHLNEKQSEPTIEVCTTYNQDYHIQRTEISNHCRVEKGGSGGAQYSRSANNQLMLSGVMIGGGSGPDSTSIAIDSNVLAVVRQMNPSIQEGSGGLRE